MKKYTMSCIALLLMLLLLVGCSSTASDTLPSASDASNAASGAPDPENSGTTPIPDNHELIVPIVDECRVSSKRTGTERQGIATLNNGFEVTDTGCYWLGGTAWGDWLLYSDHGSDEVIKLCGRPDCPHSTKDCNAYYPSGSNVCYYEGYLYIASAGGVYRLNLDGTERLRIFDFSDISSRGANNVAILNGLILFNTRSLDEDGKEVFTHYYYKLDGSMEQAEKAAAFGFIKTDGDVFCGEIGYEGEFKNRVSIIGTWDPDTNTTTEWFRTTEDTYDYAYFGSEAIYYMEGGVIYEYAHATGDTAALCDTGLTDWPYYRVICFPDTVVVTNYAPSDPSLGVEEPEVYTLYFYDWNFNYLGSVAAEYPYHGAVDNVICGETHERFILTDYVGCVPRYYIEKSDLGSGNIAIHDYELDFPYYSETGVSYWKPATGEGYGEAFYPDP